jgi:hypothetical protein
MPALVQKSGFVAHQHGVCLPPRLEDGAPQFIAHGIRVPQGPAPQVLTAIERGITDHLGPWPAVRALGGTQQSPQLGHRPLPGLGPLELGRQPTLDSGHIG